MLDLVAVLQAGIGRHQAGDLAGAEAAYREVLAVAPAQDTAAYLLGMVLLAAGRPAEALGFLRLAARLRPMDAAVRVNLANAAVDCGAFAEAEAACVEALALRPGLEAAVVTLGRALLGLGRAGEAVEVYRQAVSAVGVAGLGMAWLHLRRPEAAVLAGERAVALAPELAEAWFVLGTALVGVGRGEAGETALRRAVTLAPGHARAWANLGNAEVDQDRYAAAVACLERAVALDAGVAEAWASLGFVLAGMGRLGEAVAACDRAIGLRGDFAEAHWNKSFAHLLAGDFAAGWEEYEWRKRHDRFARDFLSLPGVEWAGEDLAGKHLLVQAEQGLGDTIQFARYLPVLAGMAGRVTIACAAPLLGLLRQLPVAVVRRDAALPDYDFWVDQMSLPRLLGTTLANIPAPEGYLRAEGAARGKIGLVWAGNPLHSNDRRRSMPVAALAPLVAGREDRFVSLQLGPQRGALAGVEDLAAALVDFAATAEVVAGLELVIAVDTSTAHLAAALGKPVFLLLPYAPDWRWMCGREDSPWYRSVRIFRQAQAGDWADVVRRVKQVLLDKQLIGSIYLYRNN